LSADCWPKDEILVKIIKIIKLIFCIFFFFCITVIQNICQRYATLRWLEVRNRSIFGLAKTLCETIIPLNSS
jgi:hypothetical protein